MDQWVLVTFGTIIGGVVVGGVLAGFGYFRRQSVGVGDAQLLVEAVRKEIIDLQDRRIRLLEAEVERLTRRETFLSNENETLRSRVQRLEERVHVPEET